MLKRFWQQAQPIALAVGFVLIVRTVVAEPYSVPTPSMVPTLLVGDQLVGAKYAYGYSKYSLPIGEGPDFAGRLFGRQPERGDIVVFLGAGSITQWAYALPAELASLDRSP